MPEDTMLAAVFDVAGEAVNVVRPMQLPVPNPRDGEILVRMEASPIHPADRLFIAGRYRIRPNFPQVAGLEGCGIVESVGTGVDLQPGIRVAFRHPGCWAQYAVVPAGKATVVPADVPVEAAAQYALNPVTAWALLCEARVSRDDWIVVNAATSTVASLVCSLAMNQGVRVVGIYREGQLPQDRKAAVTSNVQDLAAAILGVTAGRPVAGLLDAIGGDSVTRAFPALKAGARILSYGMLGNEPARVNNGDLIYRNLTWAGFGIDHWLQTQPAAAAELPRVLWPRIADRTLALPVKARWSLTDIRRALASVVSNETGKTLVVPGLQSESPRSSYPSDATSDR